MLTTLALLLMLGVAQAGTMPAGALHELRAAVAAAEAGAGASRPPARVGAGWSARLELRAAAPRVGPRCQRPIVGRPAPRAPGASC